MVSSTTTPMHIAKMMTVEMRRLMPVTVITPIVTTSGRMLGSMATRPWRHDRKTAINISPIRPNASNRLLIMSMTTDWTARFASLLPPVRVPVMSPGHWAKVASIHSISRAKSDEPVSFLSALMRKPMARLGESVACVGVA